MFIGLARFPECHVSWFKTSNISCLPEESHHPIMKGQGELNAISELGVCGKIWTFNRCDV